MQENFNLRLSEENTPDVIRRFVDVHKSPLMQLTYLVTNNLANMVDQEERSRVDLDRQVERISARLEGTPVRNRIQNALEKRLRSFGLLEQKKDVGVLDFLSLAEGASLRRLQDSIREAREAVEDFGQKYPTDWEKLKVLFPSTMDEAESILPFLHFQEEDYTVLLEVKSAHLYEYLHGTDWEQVGESNNSPSLDTKKLTHSKPTRSQGFFWVHAKQKLPLLIINAAAKDDADRPIPLDQVRRHEKYHALRHLTGTSFKMESLDTVIRGFAEGRLSEAAAEQELSEVLDGYFGDYLYEEVLAYLVQDESEPAAELAKVFLAYAQTLLGVRFGASLNLVSKSESRQRKFSWAQRLKWQRIVENKYAQKERRFSQAIKALEVLQEKGYSNREIAALFTPIEHRSIPPRHWLLVAVAAEEKRSD